MEAIFETNPVFLSTLLGDLKSGKIQLPDFQKGWVWEDERIRGVLASVSRAFPIGALMMLETGGETKFHPRPVEGVNLPNGIEPDLLVLDGQQRLTSLFQATTYGKVVTTMNTSASSPSSVGSTSICAAHSAPNRASRQENRLTTRTTRTMTLTLTKPREGQGKWRALSRAVEGALRADEFKVERT